MAKKEFFLLIWGRSEASAILFFVGVEAWKLSDHSICWEELNFGQEPVFLEASILNYSPPLIASWVGSRGA